jgi:hypothetical protein
MINYPSLILLKVRSSTILTLSEYSNLGIMAKIHKGLFSKYVMLSCSFSMLK